MVSGEFGFKKFTENAFYKGVNIRLVEAAQPTAGQHIVDLACGTGLVTTLLAEKLQDAKESLIIAFDHSSSALRQAKEELGNAGVTLVEFVQGRMEELSDNLKQSVDTIVFGNGIHYVPDKASLLEQVFASLKPGGTFVFNTSFYEGWTRPESQAFARRWMARALRELREQHGLRPIRAKVESRNYLTADQYCELLETQGFSIKEREEISVEVPVSGWVDISEFEDFIAGAMPGVPLATASPILQNTARQTFSDMNLTHVPRNWLQIVATRSA
jgi:ubiquinone/menaquinone biosynthesis C-methylase UbiE